MIIVLDMQYVLLSLFSKSGGGGPSFYEMVGSDTVMAGSKGPNYIFSFLCSHN